MRSDASTAPMTWRLALLWVTLILSGCDGGLFGTGDSSEDGDIIAQPTISNPTTGGGAGDGFDAGTDAEGADTPTNVATIPLNNSLITTARNDAVLQVLNFTNTTWSVSPVIPSDTTIEASTASTALVVPPDTVSIELESVPQARVASLSPISLAAGSATGVLLRDADAQGVDIDTYTIRTRAGSDDTSLIRAILAESSAENTVPTVLQPTGSAQGAVTLALPALPVESPIGEYMTALPGGYIINTGSNQLALELLPGSAYSLVINPTNTGTPLQLLIDSELE